MSLNNNREEPLDSYNPYDDDFLDKLFRAVSRMIKKAFSVSFGGFKYAVEFVLSEQNKSLAKEALAKFSILVKSKVLDRVFTKENGMAAHRVYAKYKKYLFWTIAVAMCWLAYGIVTYEDSTTSTVHTQFEQPFFSEPSITVLEDRFKWYSKIEREWVDGVKRISVDTQVKTIRKNGKSYTVPLGTVKNATTVKEATNYAIGIGGYSYDDDKLLSTVKDDYAMKTGTGITDAEITTVDIDLRELKSESLTLSGRGIDSVVLYGLLPYGILNGSAWVFSRSTIPSVENEYDDNEILKALNLYGTPKPGKPKYSSGAFLSLLKVSSISPQYDETDTLGGDYDYAVGNYSDFYSMNNILLVSDYVNKNRQAIWKKLLTIAKTEKQGNGDFYLLEHETDKKEMRIVFSTLQEDKKPFDTIVIGPVQRWCPPMYVNFNGTCNSDYRPLSPKRGEFLIRNNILYSTGSTDENNIVTYFTDPDIVEFSPFKGLKIRNRSDRIILPSNIYSGLVYMIDGKPAIKTNVTYQVK